MDSRGRITVVLTWEKDGSGAAAGATALTYDGSRVGPSRQASLASTIASGGPPPRLLGVHARSISQVRDTCETHMGLFCGKTKAGV